MGSHERMSQFSILQADQQGRLADSLAYGRLNALLDPDSYVSIDALVQSDVTGSGFARAPVVGDGVLTGYGTIDGRLVYLAAQDPAVYGGSIGVRHAAKITKTIDLALAAGAPFIGLYETGGVRIEEGLSALEAVSELLAHLTAASGEIPLISAVYGSCAGSASFLASAGDVLLMEKTKASLTVNGPGVIAAIENNALTPQAIGGAMVHAKSGLATFVEPDEASMAKRIRQVLDYLPDTADGFLMTENGEDDPNRCEPGLDTMADGLDQGVDVRQMVDLIVDQGSFLELQSAYAPGLLSGLARLDGRVTGILACSGSRISAAMADKAVFLTDLCDRFAIPLVTLLDSEGFDLGSAAEQNGLALAGTHLFKASRFSRSPRLAVITGKAFGPAYLSLASKGSGADLVLAWPTAEISALAPDTAAHILYRAEIAAAANPQASRQEWVEHYATQIASPYAAAAKGLVDEIIRPSATRPRLISALTMLDA
ncbi:MAG: AccA [Firmicutes bacterium]|nr:AccA [Bacillota bacterium]